MRLHRMVGLVMRVGVVVLSAFGFAGTGSETAPGSASPVWGLSPQARRSTLEAGGRIARASGAPFDLLAGAADPGRGDFADLRALLVENATRSTRESVAAWQERDRRMQQMQQQIQNALPRPAPVQGAPTPAQIAWAEYQARQANLNALNAAQTQGFQQGLVEARKESAAKQVDMALDAASSWQPPKAYRALAAGLPSLEDPFASPVAAPATGELADALRGSCLAVDAERGVAVVAGSCAADPCLRSAEPGDYPFLEGGQLIDTPSLLAELRTACASHPPLVLRAGSQVVALEKAA